MSLKGTVTLFESSGGARIYRIPLEAFPKFQAYAYLVRTGDDCILVDCGSGTEISHGHLLNGLEQAGFSPSDLTHILLTHAHIDHFGGLSKLRPLTNARIGIHDLDLQTVAHHEARLALISRRIASFLAEAGLAEEERDQLLGVYRFTKAVYRSTPVDFVYGDQAASLDIVHLPGHSPGHVAMRLDDVIFCGDMVVRGVTPHLSPESISPYCGLGHYLVSLERLRHWAGGARLIFNGHDDVITDLHPHIESTRENIIRRMGRALDALVEPHTIAETCHAVYGEIAGYNGLLVIEKTGAYVEYLYEHGMLEIVNPDEMEQGGPARYRRLREIPDSEILPKEKSYVLI